MSASFSTVSISFFTIRPTGTPVQSCTTDADRLLVDARQDQRRFALQRRQLLLQLRELAEQLLRALRATLSRRHWRRRPAASASVGRLFELAAGALDRLAALAQLGADREHALDELALGIPALFERARASARRRELFFRGPAPLGGVDADGFFAADDLELGLQRLDRARGSPRAAAARRAG